MDGSEANFILPSQIIEVKLVARLFLLASIVPKARECGFVLWTFLSNMSNSLIFFSSRMYIQKKSKITQAAI